MHEQIIAVPFIGGRDVHLRKSWARWRTAGARSEEQTFWHVILSILLVYTIGLVLLSVAASGGSWMAATRAFSTSIVVGAAVAVVGGLTGFLFGVPRSFAPERTRTVKVDASVAAAGEGGLTDRSVEHSSAPAAAASPERETRTLWANNNLVEVSDWLTKIVVGVGLVQLHEIVGWSGGVGAAIGEAAFGTGPAFPPVLQKALGVSVILLNFGLGFFVTYIYARTLLTAMFDAVLPRIEQELEQEIGEIHASNRNTQSALRELAREMGRPSSVLAHLYLDQPDGFLGAIDLAKDLLRKPEYKTDADLHVYLARGLGQKYRYDRQHAAQAGELESVANEAHEAIKAALAIDDSKRDLLQRLWDPTHTEHIKSENDLVPFWMDEQQREKFSSLLRRAK